MMVRRVKISDLGTVITGNTPPRKEPDLYGSAYPFIKPTDIELDTRFTFSPEECYSEKGFEKYKRSLIPKGSTCVVTIGSIGKKITMAHSDCFINQAMNAVVPNESYHPYYVFYLLKQNLQKVKASDSGTSSGRENVSKSAFSSIEVDVIADQDVQARVGLILSAYDDLIENNLRRIKLLEEAARCRYKLLMENEKTEIRKLGDEATLIMGQSPPSSTYNDTGEGLPFHQGVTHYGFRFVENEGYCSSPTRVAEAADILLSVRAPVGRLNFATEKICIGRGLSAVRHRHGYQQFQYQQLKDFFYIEDRIGNGSTFNATTKKELETLELPYPDMEAIAKFEISAVPLHQMMVNLTQQNKSLREARDILLPRLMSGEIDVSSVAIPTDEIFEPA